MYLLLIGKPILPIAWWRDLPDMWWESSLLLQIQLLVECIPSLIIVLNNSLSINT
jgi:hypothetical protein